MYTYFFRMYKYGSRYHICYYHMFRKFVYERPFYVQVSSVACLIISRIIIVCAYMVCANDDCVAVNNIHKNSGDATQGLKRSAPPTILQSILCKQFSDYLVIYLFISIINVYMRPYGL